MSLTHEWLGLTPYQEALQLQLELSANLRASKNIHILGLEHPTVVTLGRRAKIEEELPLGALALQQRQIECINTDRGGQATLHSPGQLVIYPLVPLTSYGWGVRQFVNILEESLISSFASFGIESYQREGDPGIYTDQGKIAFCGLRVDRGVTRHGLSVNISNDLHLFELIRPCGVSHRPMNSALRQEKNFSTQDFFEVWVREFQDRAF